MIVPNPMAVNGARTVSVVIPTYNRLPLLREAVESVFAQTWPSWELIVVDDGSIDGTAEYLRSLADPRVRPVLLPHTGNVARLRNAGVAVATGEYLAFLDSDDLWLPRKLEVQLERMRRTGVRWSYTRYEHIDRDGRSVPFNVGGWKEMSGRIALEVLTAEATVCICTVMVERSVFLDLDGFDQDRDLHEDQDLAIRLALAEEVLAIPDTLALARDHAGRSIYSGAGPFARSARMYDKWIRVLDDPALRRAARRRRAHYLAESGKRQLESGAVGDAVRSFARSFLDRPNYYRWTKALAKGIAGRLIAGSAQDR